MRIHEISQIKTARLTLRPFNMNDANDVFQWCSDLEVTKYASYNKHVDIAETKEILRTILCYDSLAIVENISNKCIGSFGLIFDDALDVAEFGYALNKDYWHNGYMSETIDAMIIWLRDNSNFTKLVAEVHCDNFRSINVLKRNGFTYICDLDREVPLKNEIWRVKKYQLNI